MPTESGALRWGIVGPGGIAESFAAQSASGTGVLQAVASRDAERARVFAERFGVPSIHASYDALLADPEVDAVYIATVHTAHVEWVKKAAAAGKHVLCEKPMGVDYPTVMAAVEAARRSGVALLEAFMYRFHPQTVKLLELVAGDAIGTVHHIDAAFSFAAGKPEGRLFDPAVAGGGVLDVGGYPVSAAHAIAAAALGGSVEGRLVSAVGSTTESGVDAWASAALDFGGAITAHLTAGVHLLDENRIRVFGSKGFITVGNPWVIAPDERPVLALSVVGQEPLSIECDSGASYALEADALAAAVAAGRSEVPEFTWSDSLANARLLEQWRRAVGVEYPFERLGSSVPTADRLPLTRKDTSSATPGMRYGRIAGVDKDISRLVMGCDNQQTPSYAAVMFDDFFERGGNAYDTAAIYGKGLQEKLVGQWLSDRGIRDEVFLIGKGAHTPHCDPEGLESQLFQSLESLQTGFVDLYMMHRDNESIPVGEFIDVLDAHHRAGRMRAFGASNWSLERFEEANEYAAANGKQGFATLSNHFGLAQAYDLPWAGCRHVTDPDSKSWLERTQVPLFPWSSQARGFFARADPDDDSDAELVRCYYSDDNFERLRRARQLGDSLGVAATAIALAYVLHQPFPTFALFGPRTLAETRTSMDALNISLTDDQVRWLDLRQAEA